MSECLAYLRGYLKSVQLTLHHTLHISYIEDTTTTITTIFILVITYLKRGKKKKRRGQGFARKLASYLPLANQGFKLILLYLVMLVTVFVELFTYLTYSDSEYTSPCALRRRTIGSLLGREGRGVGCSRGGRRVRRPAWSSRLHENCYTFRPGLFSVGSFNEAVDNEKNR
ncbi:hypothetical protein F4811DRAFT_538422 [Daldinia bambusicola]|nr:hypothetical protein F4811DRAFT_538422 [Daldinia bambusicola]